MTATKKKKNLTDLQGMPLDEMMKRMMNTPAPKKKERNKHTARKSFKKPK